MIKYIIPDLWIAYNLDLVQKELIEAKSAILSLRMIPYQRAWVEDLQYMELKREVAGTSRIEGAEFTERELDEALKETPEQLMTRSQEQAHAAMQTYRWIAKIPDDRPLTRDLVLEVHRRIVTGADDDHCEPGRLRRQDQNVTFGQPRHRGAEGGPTCETAFNGFIKAIQGQYSQHDSIIQALAAHYHLAAMHPFLDGNGRTARALEALLLQRAGLRDTCFIAMSNYYYDEKPNYLASLAESRAQSHNITPFLVFALKGIVIQSGRLLEEIRLQVKKVVFRNLMYDLFNRLQTPRKRVVAERQLAILRVLLDSYPIEIKALYHRVIQKYENLKTPAQAFLRDLSGLEEIRAIEANRKPSDTWEIKPRLEWPQEITETDFLKRIKSLPKAKSYSFLQ